MRMFFTGIRVVCQNTLSAANAEVEKNGENIVKIKHLPGVYEKVEAAKVILGLVDKTYGELQEAYDRLARHQVNDEWLTNYVKELVPAKDEEDVSTRTENVRNGILSRFESESNSLPGIKGSSWAAYNSATEFTDHYSIYSKEKKNNSTSRFASIFIGRGAEFKRRAFDIAVKMTN
jgi:hypothetical protein